MPVDHVGVWENVAQKAESRHFAGIAPGLPGIALDVVQLDLQQVPRFGSFDIDRASQGVNDAKVERSDVGIRRRDIELAVERVARLDDDPLPLLYLADRHDVLVPPIMSSLRLMNE